MRTRVAAMGLAIALAATAPAPPRAGAQLADASAVTLGLAGNATATARGLAALSMNPAGLGMGGSGFALAVLPIQLRLGLHPVTFGDLADYQGVVVPTAIREEWMERATERGAQAGTAGVHVSAFAVAVGPVGFQLSTVAAASMSLSPDVLEVILFGNAGRTGSATDLTLGGSDLQTFVITTASASLGLPVSLPGGRLALGATLKYSIGHLLAAGREQSGTVTSDPLRVSAEFPIVAIAENVDGLDNGSGLGLDLGAQFERGPFGGGITIRNLLNTFAWDEAKLAYRAGLVLLDRDGSSTDFDEQPLASAPPALVQLVDDMRFKPVVSVGGAWKAAADLTLSADVRKRFGEGLVLAPAFHAGVGAEYRGLRALHVRGGVAVVTDAVELAGGASLALGPVNFSVAGAVRRGELESTSLAQFTLSFGGG